MIKFALLIALKDVNFLMRSLSALIQALLLGLIIIFIFSLTKPAGDIFKPYEVCAVFWLSSVFFQILIFNQLYALEEKNSTRLALALTPWPVQGIWLGKGLAALLALLIGQIVFLPAIIIFFNQNMINFNFTGFTSFFTGDIGLCSIGSLLGAIGRGQNGKETLLNIILFPLILPLLLASIAMGAQLFGEDASISDIWFSIALSFDAIFIGLGLLFFGFLYSGDE